MIKPKNKNKKGGKQMISKLKKFLRGEGGITGLETAIILIAFVVVAAVFAFTVLSAGVFSADRGKEAVYSGLAEVSGSMEVVGSVIAESSDAGTDETVDTIIFSLSNVAGGEAIDFTVSPNNKVVIDYRDKTQYLPDMLWSKTELGPDDGDELLEQGELFEISVSVISGTSRVYPGLGINMEFVIEVKPETGGVIVIERTTPAYIDKIIDLH